MYSVAGSLGIHLLVTLGAGSFLINISKNIIPPKTFKLEFVKRETPPPEKMKEIRKNIIPREVKVASLPQPKPMPSVQPRVREMVQEKTTAQPTNVARVIQSRIVPVTQPKITVLSTNVARTSVSVPNSAPRRIKSHAIPAKTTAVIQSSRSTITRRAVANIPISRSFTSTNQTTSETSGRKAPVKTGAKMASFTMPTPRGVPNIVDRGALKGYMGQIKRQIEGAKRYPEASRKAGQKGKLKIQFTLLKNGEVENIKLLTQTPYPHLNKEAMAAVKRAAPFSGFPDSVIRDSMNIILPFNFELN